MSMKWISLAVLLFQNGMTPIFFRYATTGATASERFSTAVAVMCAEFLKLAMSLVLLYVENDKKVDRVKNVIRSEIINKPTETLKLAVPAVLYFIQNNVLQLSSSNLPAAVFQVTYQGKTLVVAVCSIMLLGKLLTRSKWLALALMAMGLAVVQLSKSSESKQVDMANNEEQNVFLGLCLVVLGCFCSGFAGVYFEKMMKKPETNSGQRPSMWVRNIQLAAFSIVVGFIPVLTYDAPDSFFHGFTFPVWCMVVNNAIGGLCVAAVRFIMLCVCPCLFFRFLISFPLPTLQVIKYADNLLKGFACALATILTCFVSIPLFGFQLNTSFFFGMVVVFISTLIYGGMIKLPGDWWNKEPQIFSSLRVLGDTKSE